MWNSGDFLSVGGVEGRVVGQEEVHELRLLAAILQGRGQVPAPHLHPCLYLAGQINIRRAYEERQKSSSKNDT